MTIVSQRRRYAITVMARETLRDAAQVLTQRGIPVMPLKGVLFQQVLYADPVERLVSDVDILVPEPHFPSAIAALLDAGFQPEKAGRSLIEVALRSGRGLCIDLHSRLFSPARYALSTASVFGRATLDTQLFEVPVHIAHPHDTAAHLIGKLVSDHVTAEAVPRLRELLLWCEHCRLDPVRLARHLRRAGMARAARYVFTLGIEQIEHPFFRSALEALPADLIGEACVRLARELMPRLQSTPLAAVPAHLLNASLPWAAAAISAVALNRFRHARLTRGLSAGSAHWKAFFPSPS